MTFYRLDNTRLSFREYWRWKPGLPFLFLAVKKILGIRGGPGQIYARPEVVVPIGADDLPRKHRAALGPLVAQAWTLGFELHFYYSVPTRGRVTGAAAALTSADRLSLLLLIHSEPRNAPRPVPPAYAFYSFDADGPVLATSGGLPGLIEPPPEFQVVRLRHGTLDQTWNRHAQRLSGNTDRLVPFPKEQVADTLLRILQRHFDYNLGRGVWVPVPDSESDQADDVGS
jgi:hypothetical protein